MINRHSKLVADRIFVPSAGLNEIAKKKNTIITYTILITYGIFNR